MRASVSKRKQIEISLKLGSRDSQIMDVVSAVDAALKSSSELLGHEIGSHDCRFFVRGELSEVQRLIAEMSESLSLPLDAFTIRLESGPATGGARKKTRRPRLFDIWAVPLSGKLFGYVQLVWQDKEVHGDLIRVFSLKTKEIPPVDDILESPELFPPVFTLVRIGISDAGWTWVANVALNFELPVFRDSIHALFAPGTYGDWSLWHPEKGFHFVGRLNREQCKLEMRTTWSPQAIADRISTGKNEFAEERW